MIGLLYQFESSVQMYYNIYTVYCFYLRETIKCLTSFTCTVSFKAAISNNVLIDHIM